MHHQVDVADVQTQLERCRGDDRLQSAGLKPLFGILPAIGRQRTVMTADGVFAQQLRQVVRDPLGHAAGVDENQRAAMRLDQLAQPGIDFGPLFVHTDGAQVTLGSLDRQIEIPLMTDVDDGAVRDDFCCIAILRSFVVVLHFGRHLARRAPRG